MGTSEPRWTIAELGRLAAEALEAAPDYEPPTNGQVRPVPDRRTIRYYTSLGLLARPAQMRGRTALYGPRHLRELVAIKRLQARGLSLADIQGRMAGIGARELAALADVPGELLARGAARPTPASGRRVERFWRALPVDHDAGGADDDRFSAEEELRGEEGTAARVREECPVSLQRITLGRGVTLLVETEHTATPEDARAVRRAARPIIEELSRRGLGAAGGTNEESGGAR
jgi:DNA-binding transcriptional MerR regulator